MVECCKLMVFFDFLIDRYVMAVGLHCVDIAGVGSSILPTPTIDKPREPWWQAGFLFAQNALPWWNA
jgi:hypothetical protein